MIAIKNFGKAEARDTLGITMHARKNGDHGIKVWIEFEKQGVLKKFSYCLLYTSPSPRDATLSRMPSSA